MNNTSLEQLKAIIKDCMARNTFFKVTFTKKDGTQREMLCHRARKLEELVAETPSEATLKRKATLASRNILCVEEQATAPDGSIVHQWRSINLNTLTKLSANGQVYSLA